MARQWTPEQQNAIFAESGTVLVAAAAGSGKTSVLVERIVRKLTDINNPTAPSELIVVTFTNAAAAEMRYRIHKRLSEITANSKEEKQYYNLLISRLDEMQVSTMDAFCMRLVKENFHACDIEPDFSIFENGENIIVKNNAAMLTVDKLFTEADSDFLRLAKLFEKGRSDELLIKSIIKLSDFSMSEPNPEGWLEGIAENFISCSPGESVWGKIIVSVIFEQLDYCRQLILGALDDIKDDCLFEQKVVPALNLDLTAVTGLSAAFDTLGWDEKRDYLTKTLIQVKADGYSSPRGYASEPKALAAKAKRDRCIELIGSFLSLMCASESEHTSDMQVLIPASRAMIKAVMEFNEVCFSLKKQQNKYDYSDISHFALSLLFDENAEDKKTLLARELSRGVKEILIDEYQDTNRAQDTLFNCLSKDGMNMFMVGDVKQSIYRFRLASPELFIEKCNSFPYYNGKEKKSKIILSKNFRSRRGVVDAVNFMFSSLMSVQCGEIDYNEDEKLCFAADYSTSSTPDFELHAVCSNEQTDAECEGNYIAKLIKEKISGGLTVYENGADRPAEYGDFCILMRATKLRAPILAATLRKNGVPVFVEAKDGFFDAAEIRAVLSLLKAIDNPFRDVELLSVMMSPVFGFTPDDVAGVKLNSKKLLNGKAPSLYAEVLCLSANGDKKCAALTEKLLYWRRLSAAMNAGEFVRNIINDTSYIQLSLAMSEGLLRKNNLLLLCEYADKFTSGSNKSIGSFLRYLDVLRENNAPVGKAAGSAENSVSIMTMHHSKGLEFPFVIIAGLTQRFNSKDLTDCLVTSHSLGIGLKIREPDKIKSYDTLSNLAVKNRLKNDFVSEELRIMYVAMTRAREKLFVVIGEKNCDNSIEKLSQLMPHTDAVPSCCVRDVQKPSDWFLAAFMRHPDAKALRSYGGYVTKANENAAFFVTAAEQNGDDMSETDEKAIPDPVLTEKIKQNMTFSYAYSPVSAAAAKHTASALSHKVFSAENFAKKRPAFMYGNSLSPEERGTATHLFLQFCNFDAAAVSPEKELLRLISEGRLTERQKYGVDMESVRQFVFSPVMERIKKASTVYREQNFTMTKSICELDSSVPKEFYDEKTVVIGKIDLVFVENGCAVVVDYKTDNINDVSVLKTRYGDQLSIYAEAVDKCMGFKVKESILYSLKLKKYISI